MAETAEARRASSGNPNIWITSDTATVRQLPPEIDHSLPGINDPRRASASASFVPNSPYNEFNLQVQVDNADRFFLCGGGLTYAMVRMAIEFSLDAPEGNYFLLERIWSPLMGNGTFAWGSGIHPWWSISLIECHGLLGYGDPFSPLGIRGFFSQEGSGRTFEWGNSFGTGAPYPHPGYEPYDTMVFDHGAYDMPSYFSQVHDLWFWIRGRASGGGRMTFRIEVTCAVAASHAHEFDAVSFSSPGYLMFPGLLLSGERFIF